MHNYLLTIEYDGSAFSGWQIQPGLRTVQGEVEKALQEISGRSSRIICGGRTDAGVHAFGQTASFKSHIDWGEENIKKALNRALPDDITIHDCGEVAADFNARFAALSRHYQFRIYNDRSAIRRDYFWCFQGRLNFACLRRLSCLLPGEHDFGSFCVQKSHKESNLCNVVKSSWTKKGKEYTFNIIANRFLHGMVRSLVGTMIMVSAGMKKEQVFMALLDQPKRSEKVFTAPPNGLYLMGISY